MLFWLYIALVLDDLAGITRSKVKTLSPKMVFLCVIYGSKHCIDIEAYYILEHEV